jgi:Reverse transcriptase (RNA-dependent DNA polymerase).
MKVIMNRLTTMMDENQPSEQTGFRAGYSMIDHLQTVRQMIKKCQEFNINLYIAFIDYRKAFNSIEHFKVLEALRIMGINSK